MAGLSLAAATWATDVAAQTSADATATGAAATGAAATGEAATSPPPQSNAAAAERTNPAHSSREKSWPETIPRFRWWEYASTAGLMSGSLALRFTVDVSGEPTWKSGVLGEGDLYGELLIESPPLFRTWRKIGDIGYFSSFAWSVADPVIAGFSHDWETAGQMTMMNLEAFAVFSMILSVSQMVVRRERPATGLCTRPLGGQLGVSCPSGGPNPNVNRSFIGGHAGTVATAATLTCMHHARLGLWGSPQADALPCVTWTAMAALVTASRTVTGQHYLSDNLLGMGVGALSALVPFGLHYALEEDVPVVSKSSWIRPTSVTVVPSAAGVTLQMGGQL